MPHTASRFGAFLCPAVTPPELVKAIISALDADESRIIRLPFYTELLRIWGSAVGLLPQWLMDFGQKFTRSSFAVEDYGPKPDAGERLQIARKQKKEI